MSRSIPLCALFSLLILSTVDAGLAPESVAVVVNTSSPGSLSVANAYVKLRQIPDRNVIPLDGITNTERLTVAQFRTQILEPIFRILRERKLNSQIQCIAYSTDFPTAIDVSGDVGNRPLPQVLTPTASINGLTYLYQAALAADPRYLDLNANLYARRHGVRSKDTPWTAREQQSYAAALTRLRPQTPRRNQPVADALRPENDPELQAAREALLSLGARHPHAAALQYQLAGLLAQTDRTEEALEYLQRAVEAGWYDTRQAQRDPDLAPLHGSTEFNRLVQAMSQVRIEVQSPRGFRSDRSWNFGGEPVDAPAPRYLLSTVLGVSTGRGLSIPAIIENLQRSASADATRPPGTIYYVKNGDIRSVTREWGFAPAVAALKDLGVAAVIQDGILPAHADDVAGAMIGIADFDWPASKSTILPGAIVEHLTSFGGVMTAGAGQTPLTEFLRHGAAGASGTVTEPYAIQAKFPDPFLHVHYARGAALAEAFYQSVAGPYQLLIVGDPLCTPWRRPFDVTVADFPEQPVSGPLRLAPRAAAPDREPVPVDWYLDGLRQGTVLPGAELVLETADLPPGPHELSLVAFASDDVETAGRWSGVLNVMRDDSRRASLSAERQEHEIVMTAAATGATGLKIWHLGRVLAAFDGDAGSIRIPCDRVGSGPVTLRLQIETNTGPATAAIQTVELAP